MESSRNLKTLIIIPRYNITNKKNYMYIFPLGPAYISSVLKKKGYEVDCLNLNHYEGYIGDIIGNFLNKKSYDFVGIGNNALGYSITKLIIDSIRSCGSKPRIILGGPIITTNPELIFNSLNPDIGVIGEAEESIVELFEKLEKNQDISEVAGIIYKKNGNTIITKKRLPVNNIDSIPFPDFEGFEFEKLLDNMPSNYFYPYNAFDYPRVYPILCSRGCPFQCTFCYHEGKYRIRSLDSIFRELELMVKKYRINMVSLYDDCFAIDKERLRNFCMLIDRLRKKTPWELKWCTQFTVRDVNQELLEMMKKTGCDSVSYGFESFDQGVLKSMRKPIIPEQIDYAFKETLKAGMAVQANFIFGDVAETKETADRTLEYWKKNAKGQIWLDFIQPYPGSEIYKKCLEKGIIKNEIDFIKDFSSSNILNMTEKMNDREFKSLIKEVLNAEGKHSKFVIPLSMEKMEFSDYYKIEVRCPFCNSNLVYKNCSIENKFSFSFNLVCRNCHMRFFVASPLRKIAYRYQGNIRAIRKVHIKSIQYFKKIKMGFKTINLLNVMKSLR